MECKFEISLKRMACVSAAAFILEQELKKNGTQEVFCFKSKHNIRKENWCRILNEVMKKIDPELLPSVLLCKLLYFVQSMGERIIDWFEYLRTSRLFGPITINILYEKYIKKIYWTHYGTIDEVKIFKQCWLKSPEIDVGRMYNIACCYCLEEEIDYLWQEISKIQKVEWYKENTLASPKELHILGYWACVKNLSTSSLFEVLNVPNNDQSVDEHMLGLCARLGYYIAFKYFWNRLPDEEKERNAITCLEIVLEHLHLKKPDEYKDRYFEIVLFLRQNLSETIMENEFKPTGNRNRTLIYFEELVFVFTVSLPWQELFVPALRYLFPFCDEAAYRVLFWNVSKKEKTFHLPFRNSEMEKIFYQLWSIIPSEYKLHLGCSVLYSFYEWWELSAIKFILNDNDLAKYRESLLNQGYDTFFKFLKNNEDRNVSLQTFCVEVLIPKNLSQAEQMHLTISYMHLLEKKVDYVEKLFSNYKSSDVIKRRLKNELKIKYIIFYFLRMYEFDLADKFLFWFFESNEKVNNFKKFLKNYKLSREYLYYIWYSSKDNLELAKSRSVQFFNWLLMYSEDEINQFKIQKLNTAIDYKIFCLGLILEFGQDLDAVSDFLSWCSYSEGDINLIKDIMICLNNLNYRMVRYFEVELL